VSILAQKRMAEQTLNEIQALVPSGAVATQAWVDDSFFRARPSVLSEGSPHRKLMPHREPATPSDTTGSAMLVGGDVAAPFRPDARSIGGGRVGHRLAACARVAWVFVAGVFTVDESVGRCGAGVVISARCPLPSWRSVDHLLADLRIPKPGGESSPQSG
jgi:hypothetical protein